VFEAYHANKTFDVVLFVAHGTAFGGSAGAENLFDPEIRGEMSWDRHGPIEP
jgi:hypothetical protein